MATILVVDDEKVIRTLLKAVLGRAGYSVFEAANGLEAVAVFRSFANQIDLVLTDLTMPVMNGAEAVARIRETRPAVPIICMSGYSEEEVPRTRFVQKPFELETILQVVKEVLG